MATVNIKTPGSIWAKLIDQNAAAAKKPEGRGDAYVYFVGARGSGKSTLLNRFLYPTRVEVPKPSEGLEYTYARKPSNFDHEKKDLAHIWEVGGSAEFAEEIATSDQLFLTIKQVTTAVVVIVVDLSDPASILPSLLGWLEHIKRKLGTTYEKFEKKGLQLPEQLRQRAKNKLYSSNEDKDVVYHSGVSIVIAATKYDTFLNQESEVKKIVSRALRYIAHAHGAFLMFLGGLHSLGMAGADSGGKETTQNKSLLDNFTRLLNHLIFTGLEKKPALKLSPQLEHAGPLMVPAGTDRFRDIGRPRGIADANVAGGLQEWRETYEKLFPPKAAVKASKFEIDERYKEEEIDLVAKRKMLELDAYRREQDAAKKKTTTTASKTSGSATKDKAAKDSSKDTPSKESKSSSKTKEGASSSGKEAGAGDTPVKKSSKIKAAVA